MHCVLVTLEAHLMTVHQLLASHQRTTVSPQTFQAESVHEQRQIEHHLLDNRLSEPLIEYPSLRCHREDSGESKTLNARNKTTDLLTERGWQHRHGPLNKIHACRPLASITIERSVGLHKVGYICNVNADLESAIIIGLYGQGIVQVFSRLGVNSEDPFLAQVLANLILPFRDTTMQ